METGGETRRAMFSQVLSPFGGPEAEGVPNSKEKSRGAAHPGSGPDAWGQGIYHPGLASSSGAL